MDKIFQLFVGRRKKQIETPKSEQKTVVVPKHNSLPQFTAAKAEKTKLCPKNDRIGTHRNTASKMSFTPYSPLNMSQSFASGETDYSAIVYLQYYLILV
jgi:hypothetical protein